jgi:hypothetical protein
MTNVSTGSDSGIIIPLLIVDDIDTTSFSLSLSSSVSQTSVPQLPLPVVLCEIIASYVQRCHRLVIQIQAGSVYIMDITVSVKQSSPTATVVAHSREMDSEATSTSSIDSVVDIGTTQWQLLPINGSSSQATLFAMTTNGTCLLANDIGGDQLLSFTALSSLMNKVPFQWHPWHHCNNKNNASSSTPLHRMDAIDVNGPSPIGALIVMI